MKSPRCTDRTCRHGMSEHGPNGCGWCACKVSGTNAKPWEQSLAEQINTALASPAGESRDGLLRSLSSGHDEFSAMSTEALRALVPHAPAGRPDVMLRWMARGLPAADAQRKVDLDAEKRSGYAALAVKL